jgi:hypothetical protein
MRHLATTLFLVSLAALGCQRAESTFAVAPSVGKANQPAKASEAYPSKEEVLDYLDGKTISLSASEPPKKGDAQFVLKRDQIEALEVSESGSKAGDGPWTTGVSLLVKTEEGRYAVKMTVQHRRVEEKRAFYGFHVTEMAKQ